MKIWKILIAGVAVTVFDVIVGMITCGGVFRWVYEIEPMSVWKPMEGPPGISYYVGALVLNVVLVFFYALFSKLLRVSPVALWFQAFACPPSADNFIYGLHP